jgi:hypothetical protein
MKLREIDQKLDVFFSGEPARSGNFSSTFLFYTFLPVIAGGAVIYYAAKGIANIVKKHNEKNIETVSNVTYSTNTESSTRVPTAPSTLPKRSNKLTLRRNPEDN